METRPLFETEDGRILDPSLTCDLCAEAATWDIWPLYENLSGVAWRSCEVHRRDLKRRAWRQRARGLHTTHVVQARRAAF
jgi:hypothetical protein